MGSITCSEPDFAVLRLGLGNRKKAILSYFLGHRSSQRHWPKQQWRARRIFFCSQLRWAHHCSCCVVVRLARKLSRPCVFHVLFYSKCRTQLSGYRGWQAAWTCLFRLLPTPVNSRMRSSNDIRRPFIDTCMPMTLCMTLLYETFKIFSKNYCESSHLSEGYLPPHLPSFDLKAWGLLHIRLMYFSNRRVWQGKSCTVLLRPPPHPLQW